MIENSVSVGIICNFSDLSPPVIHTLENLSNLKMELPSYLAKASQVNSENDNFNVLKWVGSYMKMSYLVGLLW